MAATVDESMFYEMPDQQYSRPAQIPISRKRYRCLTECTPTEEGDWIIFSYPKHFLVYNKTTRYCIFDATYVLFPENSNERIEEDAIAAVVTNIQINQNDAQRSNLVEDDFTILASLLCD